MKEIEEGDTVKFRDHCHDASGCLVKVLKMYNKTCGVFEILETGTESFHNESGWRKGSVIDRGDHCNWFLPKSIEYIKDKKINNWKKELVKK